MFGDIYVSLTINCNRHPIPWSPVLSLGSLGAYYNLFVHKKLRCLFCYIHVILLGCYIFNVFDLHRCRMSSILIRTKLAKNLNNHYNSINTKTL